MKMLDLFSGIGGISLAADWAGVETVAFCEINEFCQNVLNKHWPDVPIFDDIRNLTKESLKEKGIKQIDIVAGGSPCQPFSTAGKRRGSEDERHLWPEMRRVIQETRPTWVLFENVLNFAYMELDNTLTDLESDGYQTRTFIIPACGVGAPHRRDRTFILAHSLRSLLSTQQKSKHQAMGRRQDTLAHGEEQQLAGRSFGTWWSSESGIRRVDHEFSAGVDSSRLKALGNAVVPEQIYPIFKAIMDIEKN